MYLKLAGPQVFNQVRPIYHAMNIHFRKIILYLQYSQIEGNARNKPH